MDKEDYLSKAKQLLNDTTTYRELTNDPTSRLIKDINNNLKRLQDLGELTRSERWKMRADETTLAQFYGLPKVHKVGTPLRPIVSSTRNTYIQFVQTIVQETQPADTQLYPLDYQRDRVSPKA